MNKSELAIIIILRVIGITGLFAIPAIFLPFSWMDAIHGFMGLGKLPDAPIVSYLARSLSAFYAIMSALTLFISFDIRRYRSYLRFWAMLVVITGFVLRGIDIAAGMPMSWTLSDGPPTVGVALFVLWLQQRIGG